MNGLSICTFTANFGAAGDFDFEKGRARGFLDKDLDLSHRSRCGDVAGGRERAGMQTADQGGLQ
jgi:hypothetical protein